MLIDTHTHLYLDEFDQDRQEIVDRAVSSGVEKFFLPNLDSGSLQALHELSDLYPERCYPMMGLHPSSVKENYVEELERIKKQFQHRKYIAVGEIGIDLYWDKSFQVQQEFALREQIGWAKEFGLPVVIHSRESFSEIFAVLDEEGGDGLRGVFHSFTGGKQELERVLSYDFFIGINGIVTFKNSTLREIAAEIPPDKLLLETDSPFLAPVPKRGKRNESSFLPFVAEVMADIYGMNTRRLAEITTENALELFQAVAGNK